VPDADRLVDEVIGLLPPVRRWCGRRVPGCRALCEPRVEAT
jgi:hypothetical protein